MINPLKKYVRAIRVVFIALGLILTACGSTAPTATALPAASTLPAANATGASQVSTFTQLGVINRDKTQAAQNPFLAIGTAGSESSPGLLVTWGENSSGNVRQIFAIGLVSGSSQPLGTSVNIHTNVVADFPTITLAGADRLVPWVAWTEPSPGFNNINQVFASRFNTATGLWQQAGKDRGGGEASLNLHTNKPALEPFIFSGSGDPTKPPVPWVAWQELANNSSFTQIFVAKGVKDDTGDPTVIGGFHWEVVGQIGQDGLPTLNVDRFRNSEHPVGVFAETANTVPWVTWYETGHDRPSRVFTARGVADAKTPGGFKWINVPTCQPDETACALNTNPLKDAEDPTMAAGSLNPGEGTVPWLAWSEIGPTGKPQVFVSRLDKNTRNSFLQVGASLNADPNHAARTPIITFVGNVPYVAWLEDDGTGKFNIQLRHLASDPQTGTWALDTPSSGFNQDPSLSNFGLAAVAGNDTLFMASVEGDPASSVSQLVIGAFRVGSGKP